MMSYLLTADWHLDDQPENEYRWQVFTHVQNALLDHDISQVFVLGDMVDRKDRHSAAFVNRLLGEIEGLPMTILRGNHDSALRPPAYFEFLPNYASDIVVYTDDLLLLPFTADPTRDWQDIVWHLHRAAFLHATVTGARIDHGIVLENPGFPKLPDHLTVYSGDVHHPQIVGNVVYVGAPHHVKFGDTYDTRMLLVNEQNFHVEKEIWLTSPRRLMIDIASLADLARVKPHAGDQVKVRLSGSAGLIDQLPGAEAQITEWARVNSVSVHGTEIKVTGGFTTGVDTSQTPEAILREFAKHEGISDELLAIGLELLKEED